jgi:DNA-binding NarL/FixJ family response regulator
VRGDDAIRVMVVDEHTVSAEALALAIGNADGGAMSCVAVATNGDGALQVATEQAPDVVVVEAGPDGAHAFMTTRSLRESVPGVKALLLSSERPTGSLVAGAASAGAAGLLPKTSSLGSVVDVIPSLSHTCFTMDRKTVTLLAGSSALRDPATSSRPTAGIVTRREQDILRLLMNGVDLQSASSRLGITVNTARGYVKNLYRKLGVHNQLELLAVARERGLLRGLD